jgi:hypothetical protein
VRLLFFSDLRLGRDDADGGTVASTALLGLSTLAHTLGVDAVCGAGNVFRPDATDATGELVRREWTALAPVPIILTPGSLDWWRPDSQYERLAAGNIHVFTESRLTPVALTDRVILWGAAHHQPTETGFLDDFVLDDPDGALPVDGIHIALFHGCERTDFFRDQLANAIDGAPTAPFNGQQIAAAGLTHALVGHLPTPREADSYTNPGWAVPSPRAQLPGGAVLVTIADDGSVTRQRHELPRAGHRPSYVDTSGAGPELPPWATQVLAGDGMTERPDHGLAWQEFVRDVQSTLSQPEQARVLRAGDLAMRGLIDAEEA